MFTKGTCVLVFLDILDRCTFWLCIYCRNVSPDHLPMFIIAVSDPMCSFRDMSSPVLVGAEYVPNVWGKTDGGTGRKRGM